jgi:hypothetical protein
VGSQVFATIAASALLAGGFAAGSETRSMGALPRATALVAGGAAAAAGTEKCIVDVVRNRSGGTSQIERAERPDGRCICRIFTGPSSSNGAAETVVDALLRDRECANAPVAPVDGSTAAAGAGATGGGLGGAVLPVVFGVGAIGLGAGLAGSSKG